MPSLEELDAYYEHEYRLGAGDAGASPYEDVTDVNFRTLSQVEYIRGLGIQPRSIVDVGCGYGLLIKSLHPHFPEAKLSGVEISKDCQPTLGRLQIALAQTTLEHEGHNPFQEQFDLLACSHVLEHSGNVPRFLSICHSMVRHGGTVFFEVPNCEYEYGADGPHVVFFTPKTLRQTMERNSFRVVKCQACGPSIERWLPSRKQRLRNWVNTLPPSIGRMLRSIWQAARSKSQRQETVARSKAADHARVKGEAKDEAWFKYDQAGFKHTAVRCVARRES